MPKAEAHFDIAGLLAQVLEQDVGLVITTNNPGGFRRIVYKHMRKHPEQRIHIYTSQESENRLCLLKKPAEDFHGEEE